MPNEFARNLQDAALEPASFTLGTAGTTATSAAIDLSTDVYDTESVELELAVPALTIAMNPGTNPSGVTYMIESSITSTFATQDQIIGAYNFAGSTTTALAATKLRVRLPSNCAEFVRAKVLPGTTGGDMSTLAATLTIRF